MTESRPNVLLLFTDQHRLSAAGCYGETPCRTPNIDRLAREGVRFETAYTVCPVCSPSRGTIMTGVYPHTHGICSNVHNLGCSVHELEDRPALLSRRLESAGYALGYTGKWHLGTDKTTAFQQSNRPSLPRDMGFEGQNFPGHGGGGFGYPEYKEYLEGGGWTHEITEGDSRVERYLAGPLESTVPYFLAGHTISMMDRFSRADRPFFIWHNNWGPHGPYLAPKAYTDMYRDIDIPEWPNYHWPSREIAGPHWNKINPRHHLMKWDDWARRIRCYYAFATLIDEQIGRILAHLEKTGLDKNTIVIFTSDHGETLGSHGGLTDKGFHHFEETHRIPMIVRFPDGRHAGTVIDSLSSLADIYPTILDLARTPPDAGDVHGASLLPLIEGEAEGWREHVVTEFSGVNSISLTQRTLRWGRYKYGYNCCGPDELYDLELDPHETSNRIDAPVHRDAARELRQRLAECMEETRDPARHVFRNNKQKYYDG